MFDITNIPLLLLASIGEMSDEQLAMLYIACETEHVNRMAQNAGYVETEDAVW
jgi:hypothetical protein